MQKYNGPNIGPEMDPIGDYIEDYGLTIMIYDDSNSDKPIRIEHINYSNHIHKRWLGKLTFWATNKGYEMNLLRTNDWESRYKE